MWKTANTVEFVIYSCTKLFCFQQWYLGDDHNQVDQVKQARQQKQFYQQQNTDPKMWNISFPDSDECNKLLNKPE